MNKNKIWKMLAAAGSFAVLIGSQQVIKPLADMMGPRSDYVVSGAEQCRRLLMEIVSGSERGIRHEYRITGKDYEPETLVIAQMFPDAVNISNTVMEEYHEGEHSYVTCRIGFEREINRTEDEKEVPDLMEGGIPTGRHWCAGDLQTWKIGEKEYTFRCIDDHYINHSDDQICALFLCETVIRSDIDSTNSKREILTFGGTNNYKTSFVRKWLQDHVYDPEDYLVTIDTGVDSAYLGSTVPGTFEEGSASGLLKQELCDQKIEDELFLLSLEEALKYKDNLWKFDGESMPCGRGYWLRTPSYRSLGNEEFSYGNWVYIVDLEQGCLRPAEVTDGSIGFRPAFCLPQA